MFAAASFLLPWTAGWAFVRLLLGPERWNPVWLRWPFEWSLGWATGAALSSAFYFLLLWTGAPLFLSPLLEVLILVVSLALASRRQPQAVPSSAASSNWALRIGAAITLSLFLLTFSRLTTCAPDGEWDAFFIWNVRAKFLGGGAGTWRTAVSSRANGFQGPVAHPDYPLLTPSLLGRAWWGAGQFGPAVPVAAGLLYSLALAGVVGGAVARLNSESIGLLAVMTLLSCEVFGSWSAAQYSDIPLALYGLASLALLAGARGRRWPPGMLVLSGLLAGAAAWTKNEGIVMLVCLLAAALLYGGLRISALVAAGALPLAALTAAFKWMLAPASSVNLPATLAEAAGKLREPDRWLLMGESLLRNLFGISYWWAHPALLLGGAAAILGLIPRDERNRYFRLLVAPLGLLAADCGVFLVTRADLAWNLNTAMDRLVLQVLPSLLFVIAVATRPPTAAPAAAVPGPGRKARPKTRKRTPPSGRG